MTSCRRIYAVYRNDERSGRYTACRRRSCSTDSVNTPCKKRAVHADSVACTVTTFGIRLRGFRRTDTVQIRGHARLHPIAPGPARPLLCWRCAKRAKQHSAQDTRGRGVVFRQQLGRRRDRLVAQQTKNCSVDTAVSRSMFSRHLCTL